MPALEFPEASPFSYNIAPTHSALVIANDTPRQLQCMEWGLVPRWSTDGKNTGKLINARAEGIEEKPSFRQPIQTRRCVVPADSFYEWKLMPDKRKVPYRILRPEGQLLFMAGIWDQWGSGAKTKRTFSIVTTESNAEISGLHNRMPVLLLTSADRERWLSDLPMSEVLAMLRPAPDHSLRLYRVSEKLNKPSYDAADLHQEEAEALTLF